MSVTIKNSNNGNVATVDKKGRIAAFSTSVSESQTATDEEKSYTINTGSITLTSASESGVFYYKHNEDDNFRITAIIVILGPSTGGSTADTTFIKVYKNPTTGTLISGATAVDINSNRDFGSSSTLNSSLAYKGAEGSTITDGSQHLQTLVYPSNRVTIPLDEVLRKGNSIAVSYTPPTSNTSMEVMCAFTGHLSIDKSI